jgi:aminoglycoside phosphotransferase (APT) family kinase protein
MSKFVSETIEVLPQHKFDEAVLESYMRENVEGFSGNLTVNQFKGGQSNPTFLLSDANKRYVMRKKPPGKLLPSAHAVDREYRVITALKDTDVPVPRTYALCQDDSVIGTAFYVMDLVEGRIFRDPGASAAKDTKERGAIFDSMNDTMAKLHLVDWAAVGLSDYGKPGNYMARQINRLSRQYEASKTHEIKSMDNLLEWLPENIPSDDSTSIAHGDFRLENMIIHPTEPRVIALLDWELSTLGHPLADLAYNCMQYHLPVNASKHSGFDIEKLEELGIPSEEDYLAAYCRRTGREGIPSWEFFMAFGIFRLAAIVQGVYKRGLDGIASSETAITYRDMVQFLSDAAWDIVST